MSSRPFGGLAVCLVALISGTAWSASARADDVIGVVQSVDAESKTIIVRPAGSDIDTKIVVNDQTRIEAGEDQKVDISSLRPGTRIVVHNLSTAFRIEVPDRLIGQVQAYKPDTRILSVNEDNSGKVKDVQLSDGTPIEDAAGKAVESRELRVDSHVIVTLDASGGGPDTVGLGTKVVIDAEPVSLIDEALHNFKKNLFKPLLLFFFMGFLVPLLKVQFEFPYVIYQGLTIYLLIAIGWKGGEELSELVRHEPDKLLGAVGFMGVGFVWNFVNGILAYLALSFLTKMRRIDKATVAGYYGSDSAGTFVTCVGALGTAHIMFDAYMPVMLAVMEIPGCLVALYLVSRLRAKGMDPQGTMPDEPGYDPNAVPIIPAANGHGDDHAGPHPTPAANGRPAGILSAKLLHEVFLNPGLYLLFGGILIGLLSGLQGKAVTRDDDNFFISLFQGILCLFLLEMGMTASRKLKDLRTAGAGFIVFGLLIPPIFASIGILVAHTYAVATHTHFELGTYVLFSVLCGAASYIAVPAVQRLAIPEASPTLPLAASLGLTFTFNVTMGIPIYILIAKSVLRYYPVA